MRTILFALLLLIITFPVLAQTNEPTYDRIMKTGTIRCGYWIGPPMMGVDPNTGKKSGFLFDLMEEGAKALELKVEWVEEVTPATMFEGLGTRHDVLCTGAFTFPARAKKALFSQPVYILPTNIYVRADDHRFDNNLDALNKKEVTFSGMDKDSSEVMAREGFPLAKLISLPQGTTQAEPALMVITDKADATILGVDMANSFMQENPGKIRAAFNKPYKAYAVSYAFPLGENKLKALFDSTITYLNGDGAINRLIAKNQKQPGGVLPPAPFHGEAVQNVK